MNILFLFSILVIVSGEEAVLSRSKRYGGWTGLNLGTYENGKLENAAVVQVIKAVVQEEEKIESILNVTNVVLGEVVDIISHPIDNIRKSSLAEVIVCLFLFVLLAVAFRLVQPLLRLLLVCFRGCATGFIRTFQFSFGCCYRSGCCMTFCAIRPFVWIRNWHRARDIQRRDKERLCVFNPDVEAMLETVTRVYSDMKSDECGLYLCAGNGKRVYFKENKPEDVLIMKSNPSTERKEVVQIRIQKETVLPASKLYKVDKVPDFQGQFDVDGTVIGHFARIKFQEKDCLLTAFHVLDYNKSALISLRKGDKAIRLDTVRARIVCASRSDELDFMIMELPSYVFSTLGLKVGQWSSRVQAREPISIHQLFEGKPCVSSASIKVSETKPWHVNYGASTLPGSSGAPILDSRNHIIGVHLEHDIMAYCNVGVIPPVFRNSRKESPTNEDIVQGQPDMELDQYEETEEEMQRRIDEEEENAYYMIYFKNDLEDLKLHVPMDWASQMDYLDERTKSRKDYTRYSVDTGMDTRGGHINRQVKRGVIRKESHWTCSKCFAIHPHKAYTCTRCGFALIKLSASKIEQKREQLFETAGILQKRFPVELVEKMLQPSEEELRRATEANQVASFLDSNKSFDPSLYPALPASAPVAIVKQLGQRLAIASAPGEWRKPPSNQAAKISNGNLVSRAVQFDEEASAREGGFTTKVESTILAKVQVVKPKRTRKRKANKETVSAVPLNSKSPAKAGEAVRTIIGADQSLSPESPKQLANRIVDSIVLASKKSQPNGPSCVPDTGNMVTMRGPKGRRKPRKSASSTSVTDIMKLIELLQKRS